MRKTPWLAIVLVSLLCSVLPAHAQMRRAAETVESGLNVLKDSTEIADKGIPQQLLCEAEAVAIIPDVIKVGFIGGVRLGRGMVLVKDKDGNWSNPVFIQIRGGSVGFQAGAQSTDVVLVFKTKKSVERIVNNLDKFTLGADAAIAAGPVGRQAAAATDVQLKAEIYSYSRSRGLFAGVALDGSALQIDHRTNAAYYQLPDASASDIVSGKGIKELPEASVKLIEMLTKLTVESKKK